MKMMIAVAALSMIGAVEAGAANWSASQDKGLRVYTLREGAARVDMVCDPEGIWAPNPEYHIIPSTGGQVLDGGTVTIKNGDQSVTATIGGGSILADDAKSWNALLAVVTAPGDLSFAAGGKTISLHVDKAIQTECLQK